MGGHHEVAPVEECADQGNGRAHLSQGDGVDPDRTRQVLAVASEAFAKMPAVKRILPAPAPEVEEDHRQAEMPKE
jgi:hypothetical protein